MMVARWAALGGLAVLAAVLCAAPVAAAGILLGVFWGTVAATLGSIAVTTAVLYIAPRVKRATLLGRALAWLRRWAIERATHPGRAVRWAYHVGGTAGFIVSSILLGPTVTSLMIALVRGSRRRLWPVVVGSSLVFSGFAVNLFAGLWALFRR